MNLIISQNMDAQQQQKAEVAETKKV